MDDIRIKEEEWLHKDEAENVLWEAIKDIKIGNKTDDKLILGNLRKRGVWLARFDRAPNQHNANR